MSRLDEIEDRVQFLEEKPTKKKKFRLPMKVRKLMRQERKKPNMVLILYLSRKYQARFMLQRIVGGDTIVVNNKAHTLNPKAIYRMGKGVFYVIREIDRKPVSNLDYNKVVRRRDDTESDVPLIKAVLGAIQKKSAMPSKGVWIALAVIAAVAIILYFIFAG